MHTHEAGFILPDRIIGLAIKLHRALGPACWRPFITVAAAGNSTTLTPYLLMVEVDYRA